MNMPQPRLGKKGMIALITICNMIAPLSTDMYMPALPSMAAYFDTTDSIMNMTLVGFFLFFAIGMLLFGPVSDKLGRRPVLMFGVTFYGLSCIGCALSTNVWFLILMRLLQAIGAGCMVAVTTAVVKDQFTGMAQSTVLSISQVFGVLGPVLAPLIGAQIYRLFGWRATFVVLAVMSAVILTLVALMAETLPKERRLTDKLLHTFLRLGEVLQNRTFTVFLLGMIAIQIPMMAYISSSSYIYQNYFGLSSTMYSLYFAGTAVFSVMGPMIYVLLRKRNAYHTAFGVFGVVIASGILLLLFGHRLPITFAASFAPIMMAAAASRPFTTTILLNMQKEHAGSAASLINFSFTLSGAIGMFLITGVWTDYIMGIAVMGIITAVYGLSVCAFLRRKLGKDSLHVIR